MGIRNRLINGHMIIDQRNAGASVALSNTTVYTVDRWASRTGTGTGNTSQQSSTAPAGFNKSNLITIGTGASPSTTATNYFQQSIEGYNTADLNWGSANAKTITLSFWVRSSLTGNFGIVISNNASDRVYPVLYTIFSANTWEQKSITIAGDVSGTWATDNSIGICVSFSLGAGSTYLGTPNAWAGVTAGTVRGVTGETQIVANSGATFYITGVQLEKGSVATPFDLRLYGKEFLLCQRYWQSYGRNYQNGHRIMCGNNSSGVAIGSFQFQTPMRAAPSVTVYGSNSTTGNIGFNYANSQQAVAANVVLSNSGGFSSLSPNGWMVNFATSMTGSIPSWADIGTQASGIGLEFSAEL
jgi:hypothetical protein